MLNERQRMVLRLDIMGKTNKQIANITGYKYSTVCSIKSMEGYKERKARMQDELDREFIENTAEEVTADPVREKLKEVKMTALDVAVRLMKEAESEHVKMKCAHDILDRAGYKPKDIVEERSTVELVDDRAREDIVKALNDIKGEPDAE